MKLFILTFLLLAGFSTELSASVDTKCGNVFEEGRRLFDENQFLLAGTVFRLNRLFDCDKAMEARSEYGLLLSMYRLGEIGEALSIIRRSEQAYSLDLGRKFRTFERLYLFENTDRSEAFESPNFVVWRNRYDKQKLQDLKTSPNFSNEPLLDELLESKFSSPGLYAGLSIVPGLGQLFQQAWSSAAIALAVNSLFAWSTYEFFDRKQYGAASVSSVLLSITYFGNIIQSGRIANKRNEIQRDRIDQKAAEILFPGINRP